MKKMIRKYWNYLKDHQNFKEILKYYVEKIKLNFLQNLKVLILYDNDISNLNGIGILSSTPIEEINLGCNKFSSLPLEFSSMITLRE